LQYVSNGCLAPTDVFLQLGQFVGTAFKLVFGLTLTHLLYYENKKIKEKTDIVTLNTFTQIDMHT